MPRRIYGSQSLYKNAKVIINYNHFFRKNNKILQTELCNTSDEDDDFGLDGLHQTNSENSLFSFTETTPSSVRLSKTTFSQSEPPGTGRSQLKKPAKATLVEVPRAKKARVEISVPEARKGRNEDLQRDVLTAELQNAEKMGQVLVLAKSFFEAGIEYFKKSND